MEERKQLTLAKEVTFTRGEKIEVIVRLTGYKENGYGKIIPIAKVLFEEIKADLLGFDKAKEKQVCSDDRDCFG